MNPRCMRYHRSEAVQVKTMQIPSAVPRVTTSVIPMKKRIRVQQQSTMRGSASVAGNTQSLGREWNTEFQDIMDQEPSPLKYLALSTLAHDVIASLLT